MAEPVIGQSLFPDFAFSGTLSSAASVTLPSAGLGNVGVEISGVWVGTIVFEGLVDPTNGTWRAITGSPVAVGGIPAQSTTANGAWRLMAAGCNQVRARMIAYTSGTANIYFEGTFIVSVVDIGATQTAIPVQAAPQQATVTDSFGNVVLSSTAQVAILHTTYTEQVANFTGSVSSSSASDAAVGVGARTVLITYLDSTGAGPFTETVTLNGTTAVNLVNANHCYIESMVVQTVGTRGGNNAGTITLFTGAGGAGTNVASIGVNDNRTLFTQHYCPTGKTTHITSFNAGLSGTTVGSESTFTIKAMNLTATSPETVITGEIQIAGAANSYNQPLETPVLFTGPARIRMYVTPGAVASNTYVGAIHSYDL